VKLQFLIRELQLYLVSTAEIAVIEPVALEPLLEGVYK
jgi:hypothetical protein